MHFLFYQKNPELNSSKDSFLELIEMVNSKSVSNSGFCRILPITKIMSLTKSEISEAFKNIGEDPFEVERKSILFELEKLIEHCYKFYKEWDRGLCDGSKSKITVQEIAKEIRKWEIRMRRISEVISPDFSVTNGLNKRTNKTYRMLKGYWVNDDNIRVRSFNKNVGISEGEIAHHYERYFRARGYNVTMGVPLSNGWIADLLIEKEKKQSIVEFKIVEKEKFYSVFMSLEMWNLYQTIYYSNL